MSQGRELFSTEELHWNEDGNRFVAETLAGLLSNRLAARTGN